MNTSHLSDFVKILNIGVAFTSTMLDPKATKHGYRFQRVFTDGEFLGAGLLVIPPGEKKPLKPSKDNTYVSTDCALLFALPLILLLKP